ncbi:MAG: hypothetical protein M3Y41_08610, partial [Pseudomonadota bacterium]|nr:hypothetical protein [Pseudomonadota bacterium]
MTGRKLLLSVAVPGLLLAGLCTASRAQEPTYARLTTIQVPGNPLVQFDISFVGPKMGTYYLADRSNAAVDIFDATNNVFLGRVGGFVGYDASAGTDVAGPNGIVRVGRDELWAGDGDST